MKLWLPKTPAAFPTKREIRHRLLNIGNYVVCPLQVLFFFSFFICKFYANCYHCFVNECAIQLTHVTYRIALNWSPTFFSSNFRIESWRCRTLVSITTRRTWLLAFQVVFNTRYLNRVYTPLAPAFRLVLFPFYLSVIMFCYLSIYFRKNIQTGNRNDSFLKREKND